MTVFEVRARRQTALDTYFEAHPERYPKGRPIADMPPQEVAINSDDGVAQTADTFLAASAEILSTTKDNINQANEPPLSEQS